MPHTYSIHELTVRREIDFFRQLGDVHFKAFLDVVQHTRVGLVRDERDRKTLGAEPPGTSHLTCHIQRRQRNQKSPEICATLQPAKHVAFDNLYTTNHFPHVGIWHPTLSLHGILFLSQSNASVLERLPSSTRRKDRCSVSQIRFNGSIWHLLASKNTA